MPYSSQLRRALSWVGIMGGTGVACTTSQPGSDEAVGARFDALVSPVSVTFQNGVSSYSGTTDTRLSQNAPTSNYGTATTLSIDGDEPSGSGRDSAALLRWSLSGIPAGSVVQAVRIGVRVSDTSPNTYSLFGMKRAWSESQATWQRAQSGVNWQSPGASGALDRDSTALGSIKGTSKAQLTVSLNAAGVALVQQWLDSPSKNLGIAIASSSNTDGLDIASSESSTPSYRPSLRIDYLPPDTGGAGSGGTGGAPAATGGAAPSGGTTGGTVPTGGTAPSDGTTGGTIPTGGTTGGTSEPTGGTTGGTSETGGTTSTTGGTVPTGGTAPSGGTTGGTNETGGTTGGTSETGGTTGGPSETGGTTGGPSETGGTVGTGGSGGQAGVPAVPLVYAAGDIGDCNSSADLETSLLLDATSDPILAIGDLAYPDGAAADFTGCFDPVWGRHKPRLRPVPGNHEYGVANATPYFEYFGAQAGEAGKGYYSFDVGDWHIVALNSNCTNVSCSVGSAQEQWLRADLAANPRACTLAFWHHARFSSGMHGNGSSVMPLWQALMEAGAEIVLSGHDHGYERFVPQTMTGAASDTGIAQFVIGTGGTSLRSFTRTQPANSVIRSANAHGVLALALRPDGYDWQFIPIAGRTFTDQGSASCH